MGGESGTSQSHLLAPKYHGRELVFLAAFTVIQFCLMQLWSYQALSLHHEQEMESLMSGSATTNTMLRYAYRSMEEIRSRSSRFPSVEDRLKVYLTSWYSPPSKAADYIQFRNLANGTAVVRELNNPHVKTPALIHVGTHPTRSRNLFRLDREEVVRCSAQGEKLCQDAEKYLLPALDRSAAAGVEMRAPILLQFGDSEEWHTFNPSIHHNEAYPDVPLVKKFRAAMSKSMVSSMTEQAGHKVDLPLHTQPIISIVCNYGRHYGPLYDLRNIDTIPWSNKKNAAIWRGSLTGRNHLAKKERHNASEICQHIPRCRFVYHHRESQLVDARLTVANKASLPIPQQMDGFSMFASKRLSIAELLEYKILVVVEGNDVSTGLKWGLFSESIVLMQKPRYTSWAMEEMLEPWIHYVPIENEDFSDTDAKVQWILEHDDAAQTIITNARLWIADLVFHPDVAEETNFILDETMRRYQAHFYENPELD